VYPLEGGNGLRLTTALYYTPGGRSIQEVGIVPDIAVDPAPPVEVAQEDNPHWRVRESDLEGHFTHEDAVPEPEIEEDSEPQAAEEGVSDVQLARALEVLKSWTYFDRLRESGKATTMHALSTEEKATAATP
jgi:carboxyl-terminal processing protease